jgi:hypothetical protein
LQGKHIGRLGQQDPGEFPEEVKALFEKAVQFYEQVFSEISFFVVKETFSSTYSFASEHVPYDGNW